MLNLRGPFNWVARTSANVDTNDNCLCAKSMSCIRDKYWSFNRHSIDGHFICAAAE